MITLIYESKLTISPNNKEGQKIAEGYEQAITSSHASVRRREDTVGITLEWTTRTFIKGEQECGLT